MIYKMHPTTNQKVIKNKNLSFLYKKEKKIKNKENFLQYLNQSIFKNLNKQEKTIQKEFKTFELKKNDTSISNLMIDMQKYSLYLSLLTEIKNKLTNGYKEIINMQV